MPWNYSWLYSKGDGALTQLGFEFFRNSPIFQWPITAVPKYVEGSHMILPTENAVPNLIGKLIGIVVSENFQFVGLWVVTCFALQGFFGAKLLSRFVDQYLSCLLGSLFFILSPALLFRIGVMNHYHLGAHWMILAALYLYFGTDSSIRNWGVLLFVGMLTSVYISAMLVVMFVAHRIKAYLQGTYVGISGIALPIAFAGLGFWVMGYLSMQSSITGSNFFRLNAIAYLNPGYSDTESFSLLLNRMGNSRIRHVFSEEWEGFQYLGTVVIAGVFLGLITIKKSLLLRNWREFAPVTIAGLGLFVFALSNRIVVMQNEVNYWWPSPLLHLRQVFRGATRFGWPAYYLIMLFAIVQIIKFCNAKKLKFGVLIATTFMMLEASPGVINVQRELSVTRPYINSLIDSTWNEIAGSHERLVIYPNFDLQVGEVTGDSKVWIDKWFDLAKFAADYDLATNFGYVPRPLTQYILEQDKKVLMELERGELQPKTLYIMSNKDLWVKASKLNEISAESFELDGLYVLSTKD